MQLPLTLSGPAGGPGTPGPMFQGPPPNVMVQQGPMGGMLIAGPPGQPPTHMHPGMQMHPGPPGMPMGPMIPDHAIPRGPPFLNLESRIYDMNKRLLDRVEDHNASLFWERFATEFFEDDATLTLSVQLDDGLKRYTIGRTLIPRYFRTIFEGGVTDLYYVVRSSIEGFQQPSTLILDCDRITMVTSHNKPYFMQVQTEGKLFCEFAYPLMPNHMPPPDDILPRIRMWHFVIINYAELIPKNLLVNLSDPAVVQDLSKNITRQGITTSTLNYLRLCIILEPMQELMSHYRICNNGQTVMPPRECLNRVVFHKYNMLRGPPPPAQPMMPPEEQPKPASKRRKRKGSSSGGTTTPTGPGGGKKKAIASPSPAIMPPVNMPSSHVDVMVVMEPTMMGGEYGDEDERFITRLENAQFDPAVMNVQMTLGSPQAPPPPLGLPGHLQQSTDRGPFDPNVGWPPMGGGPGLMMHGHGHSGSPHTPSGRNATTPSLMMSGATHRQSPLPLPLSCHQAMPPGRAMAGSQNGSRQSTPNATPTPF